MTEEHSADNVWQALANRIRQDGGEIHPSLELCEQSPGHRGVFCTQPIGVGETLIRLPSHLAVDGRQLPRTYDSPAADNDAVGVGDSTSKQQPLSDPPAFLAEGLDVIVFCVSILSFKATIKSFVPHIANYVRSRRRRVVVVAPPTTSSPRRCMDP